MTIINTPLVLLAQQCGGTFHTPGVTRAIKGMAFTFEQLEVLSERLRSEPGARKPVRPDVLADQCEAWLQTSGASNIVDAFEAGYRAAEDDCRSSP